MEVNDTIEFSCYTKAEVKGQTWEMHLAMFPF